MVVFSVVVDHVEVDLGPRLSVDIKVELVTSARTLMCFPYSPLAFLWFDSPDFAYRPYVRWYWGWIFIRNYPIFSC